MTPPHNDWRSSLNLTPITSVERFVSIDGVTVVRIYRCKQWLEGFSDPPIIEDEAVTWGSCFHDTPDRFIEVGALEEVLKQNKLR